MAVPLLVLEIVFAAVAQRRLAEDLSNPIVWLYAVQKMVRDLALYFLGLGLLARIAPRVWPRVIFTCVYLFLLGLDTALYLYGGTIIDRYYLDLLAWTGIREFLEWPVLLLIALFLGLCVLAGFLHLRYRRGMTAGFAARWGILLGLFAVLNLPRLVHGWIPLHTRQSAGWYLDEAALMQLDYTAQNPLVNALDETVIRPLFKRSDRPAFTRDPEPFRKEIDRFGLGIGRPDPPPLRVKRFRRIVVLATESLPLRVLSAHNPSLGVELTPFYDSPEVRDRTFTNYWTTSMLTARGLWVTIGSRPNGEMFREGGIPDTLPAVLRRHGWETVFMRSASVYLEPDNLNMQRLGFDRVIGKEDFARDPRLRDHIEGWGLYDRLLFEEVAGVLERAERPVFVLVLGADTHAPSGRRDQYGSLEVPDPPEGLDRFGADAPYLRSVHVHDRDVARFVRLLKERGLWTEETLLVLTADHSPPYNTVDWLKDGYGGTPLNRIPLALLTPQKLPEVRLDRRACQLDFAPTLLHLLGISRPPGWWGTSLFDPNRRDVYVGVFNDTLFIETDRDRLVIDMENPADETEQRLLKLFRTVILR